MNDVPIFGFKVDDQPYVLDYGKLTGRDLLDFQRAVGMSLSAAAAGGVEPLVWVAGVKWLHDRRGNRKLSFDDVLGSITYDQVSFEDTEVEEDPPTQEGGSSRASRASRTSTGSSRGKSSS